MLLSRRPTGFQNDDSPQDLPVAVPIRYCFGLIHCHNTRLGTQLTWSKSYLRLPTARKSVQFLQYYFVLDKYVEPWDTVVYCFIKRSYLSKTHHLHTRVPGFNITVEHRLALGHPLSCPCSRMVPLHTKPLTACPPSLHTQHKVMIAIKAKVSYINQVILSAQNPNRAYIANLAANRLTQSHEMLGTNLGKNPRDSTMLP